MKKNLGIFAAFALAFGCSIGWGAFIMPGTTFLPKSGVLGTVIGIVIGALAMLVIAWNYHSMIEEHPDAGGAFTYTWHACGYDHGFLCAWFLCLTYIALIWANASAMALMVRYTFGGILQFGFHYQIAGYDVYLGEALLCILAVAVAAWACQRNLAIVLQSLFAGTLILGILVSFFGTAIAHPNADIPLLVPDVPAFYQVMRVIAIIPWAYVGYESISHSAEEFAFPKQKSFRIMAAAIIVSGLAYILLMLTAAIGVPAEYENWVAYIADLGNLSGRKAMPTFSAVQSTFGKAGIALLGCTMFSALFTSVVGNLIASSRMIYALSREQVLPEWFGKVNKDGKPVNAILFILLLSIPIPFLGRTAIGWHVDVSNVGATFAYGYTSLAAWRWAKRAGSRKTRILGFAGLVLSAIFLFLLLVPDYFYGTALEPESYLILSGWVILGFALYRQVFKRDKLNRFGKTTAVWVALLFLGLFTALSWQRQMSIDATSRTLQEIESAHDHVVHELSDMGAGSPALQQHSIEYNALLESKMHALRDTNMISSGVVLGIVLLSVSMVIGNYSILAKKNQEQERMIGAVQKIANTDALTGVKNKSAYNEKERTINQGIDARTQTPFALVICDINNLKVVNDTQGHKAGDAFIREGCSIICNVFKHSPIFRIGGDEFVVLLENGDYESRVSLMQELNGLMTVNKKSGGIVIACGMSEYMPAQDRNMLAVFERADREMYINKKAIKGERR